MFDVCQRQDHTHIIERNSITGIYTVTIRSGITVIAKHSFDKGRDAHKAYRLSAETFINRFC